MPKNCMNSGHISADILASTDWTESELETLAAEGIAQYRAAAATSRIAYRRWRRLAEAGQSAVLLREYRLARAICDAQRVALNHLIDQLGYVPIVPKGAPDSQH